MDYHTRSYVVEQVYKASPPVTVGASILAGVQLSDVVLVATLVYTCVQCYIALHHFIKGNKKPKE